MMTPTRTISLQIDPVQTRSRVAQFFDSTTRAIADELLQNARRAGATRVDVTVADSSATITDDGCGIDDPAVLLNFGRSHWDPDTLRRETPAGMGLASLARRTAVIETRRRGAAPEDGWRVTLTPAHWRGESAAVVEPATCAEGTSVTFELLESDRMPILRVMAAAARHYALPIALNGDNAEQRSFLADCAEIADIPGGRVGASRERYPDDRMNYNFHGVIADGPGADVHGYVWKNGGTERPFKTHVYYSARFDIDDNQGIELVLPARTKVVTDEKTHELVSRAEAFLSATMLKHHPDIMVTAEDRSRIEALGLQPPDEPPELLRPWTPDSWDMDNAPRQLERRIRGGSAPPCVMETTSEAEPPDQAVVARAIEQAGLSGTIFEPDDFLKGYAWYDSLPRILRAAIRVVTPEGTTDIEDVRREMTDEPGKWERADLKILKVEVVLHTDDGHSRTLDTDVVFFTDDESWEPVLHVAADAKIETCELADFIFDACFSPNVDGGSDSYDTQKKEYEDTCRYIARCTLESSEAADEHELRTHIERTIESRLKIGESVNITRLDHGLDIKFERAAAQ